MAANNDNGSIWARKPGTDYIASAFQYARLPDPGALLFYNDYGQEYSDAKVQALVKMVKDFQLRNIPIDGLGLQLHMHSTTSRSGISNAFRQLDATGLEIHISEQSKQQVVVRLRQYFRVS